MELVPKGQTSPLVSVEEALARTMIVLPEHCSGQQEAAMKTARNTALMLAKFIALMHKRGALSVAFAGGDVFCLPESEEDPIFSLLPDYESSPYPED